MIDENKLHGMGRRIENASEGITHIYLIMDAQLKIQNAAYVSAVY